MGFPESEVGTRAERSFAGGENLEPARKSPGPLLKTGIGARVSFIPGAGWSQRQKDSLLRVPANEALPTLQCDVIGPHGLHPCGRLQAARDRAPRPATNTSLALRRKLLQAPSAIGGRRHFRSLGRNGAFSSCDGRAVAEYRQWIEPPCRASYSSEHGARGERAMLAGGDSAVCIGRRA